MRFGKLKNYNLHDRERNEKMTRSVLTAMCMFAAIFAGGAEYLFDSQADCRHQNPKVKTEFKDGSFVLKGNCHFWTARMFRHDPNKKYAVSAEIMTDCKEKVPGLTIGLVYFDDKGRFIWSREYLAAPNGFTELAKPLNPDDTVIVIKTPAGFKKAPGRSYALAFEAKEDGSDLPNPKVTTRIKKMDIAAETIALTIEKPTFTSYPTGTKVRLHYNLSFFHPVNPEKFYDHPTAEWKKIGGAMTIPRGVKNFKPAVIYYDSRKNTARYFYLRNFKLIEEDLKK